MLISSAGSLGTSTEYTLDGIRHVGALDGYPLQFPFPDALAEFKTEIGGLGASLMTSTALELVLVVTIGGMWALDRLTIRSAQASAPSG